jgi:hypothetical protein
VTFRAAVPPTTFLSRRDNSAEEAPLARVLFRKQCGAALYSTCAVTPTSFRPDGTNNTPVGLKLRRPSFGPIDKGESDGEPEIADVNNYYMEEGTLTSEMLDSWWTDAGTLESLLRANNFVAKSGANKMTRDDTHHGASVKELPR